MKLLSAENVNWVVRLIRTCRLFNVVKFVWWSWHRLQFYLPNSLFLRHDFSHLSTTMRRKSNARAGKPLCEMGVLLNVTSGYQRKRGSSCDSAVLDGKSVLKRMRAQSTLSRGSQGGQDRGEEQGANTIKSCARAKDKAADPCSLWARLRSSLCALVCFFKESASTSVCYQILILVRLIAVNPSRIAYLAAVIK